MWCTNASIAEYIITLVRTDPKGGSRSLSMILVPNDSKGLVIGPAEKKMGLHGSPMELSILTPKFFNAWC